MVSAKRVIDQKRDAAFGMTIGSDDGEIVGAVSMGARGLILKKNAVYEVITADHVDPERTNIAIPHSQRRLLSVGSNSTLLGQTLLTADALIKDGHLEPVVGRQDAMRVALAYAEQLLAMDADSSRLAADVSAIEAELAGKRLHSGFIVPTTDELASRCDAFVRRAHQSIRLLLEITRMFEGQRVSNLDSLVDLAKVSGDLDYEAFCVSTVPKLRTLWNLRNAIEHPKTSNRAEITDYKLNKAGELVPPSMGLVHPQTGFASLPVDTLFREAVGIIGGVFENNLALLCRRHCKMGKFEITVGIVPVDRRRYATVQYGYFTKLQGEWHPLG